MLACAIARAEQQPEPLNGRGTEALVTQLNEALESRDRLILELMTRVKALEEAVRTTGSAEAPNTFASAATPSAAHHAATLSADDELDEADRLAKSALERTLISTGGMLLPKGVLEIDPSLSYSLSAANAIDIDCLLIEDILCIGDINSKSVHRESYNFDWTLRLGLPWQSQLDVRVPFGHITSSALFGNGTTERSETTSFGDVELAMSRQLLRGQGWKPDLVGELRWKSTTGTDPFDQDEDSLATGTGFDDVRIGLTAVKVRDPLVLFGNVNYSHSFPDIKPEVGKVQPGDGIGVQLGMAIALNLETSLNFGWNQSWIQSARVNGEKVASSFRRSSSLRIGATYVAAARRSIDFGIAIGLTDDVPDVEVRLSFPLRLAYRLPFPY